MTVSEKLAEYVENIKINLGLAKKKVVIPEEWLRKKFNTPMDWLHDVKPTPAKKNPVARKPRFSFDIPRRDFSFLRSNLAFKTKRTVMFLLMVACIISIFSFALINPWSLLYYIPVAVICLDFLRRTQTKKRKIWLVLDDIEDDT